MIPPAPPLEYRRYQLSGLTREQLDRIEGEAGKVNSIAWRGHAAHTLRLGGFYVDGLDRLLWGHISVAVYEQDAHVAHIVNARIDRGSMTVIDDSQALQTHSLTDFNALPIGDEIEDKR